MKLHPSSTIFVAVLALVSLLATVSAGGAKSEITGAAILDHPCGKLAAKHMGLVHAGKVAEAVKLGTAEMQAEWNALPAEDREMMSGMMKEMAQTEEAFSADIKAFGVLVVDGKSASLTVTKETKDENGTSTSTMTQKYVIDGASCAISR